MPGIRRWTIGIAFLVAVLALSRPSAAVPGCPFCAPGAPPFSTRMAECNVALLATWESRVTNKELAQEVTTFLVVAPFKKGTAHFEKGERITWEIGRDGKPGDVYLLLGSEIDGKMVWSPISIPTDYVLLKYIKNAPAPEAPNRLEFFLKFLEFPDSEVAGDAYAEFSRAQFQDVAALAAKIPKSKLRQWLASTAEQMQIRLGLYGMMLGLCGDDDDAAFLEELILKRPEPDKPRFGVDGMMAGYIMLRGERGLQKLVAAKFDDPLADSDLPLLKNAIVFLWDYCQDRIPASSLKLAMRRMLEHPKWGYGVLEHLARWKDWDSLEPVLAHYGVAPFDTPTSREKIILFALVCEKDGRTKSPTALPASAIRARKFLNTLDPAIVKSAERSLGGLPKSGDSKSVVPAKAAVQQSGSPGQ